MNLLRCAIFLAALAGTACGVPPASDDSAAAAATEAPAEDAAGVAAELAAPVATGAAAAGAAESDAEAMSATARALAELSGAYDELASLLGRNSGEAVDWAQSDFENLGDWEYRVVELGRLDSADLEAELNALGNERWEVFWIETTSTGVRAYLKRSAISYLSRLPLSTLLRLLSAGGQ